jgi:5-methylcytosine-specific restriction endonuclease McrA
MEVARSWTEAREKGLTTYFTGKPCKHGHIAVRHAKGGNCSECAAAMVAKWRAHSKEYLKKYRHEYSAANRAALREARREYERLNPDYVVRNNANTKRWAEKNKAYLAEYRKQWAGANPEREAAYLRNKRARRRNNGGKHSADDMAQILALQGGKCACCGCVITRRNKTVDHIVPSYHGGRNDRSNLQILCRSCNSSKGTRDPVAFMRERGRLL